jgi:hypothetical protein
MSNCQFHGFDSLPAALHNVIAADIRRQFEERGWPTEEPRAEPDNFEGGES